MSSQPLLSPAEQAAAVVLEAEHTQCDCGECIGNAARAVVAAVHDLVAAKTLMDAAERVLDQADRVREKFPNQPKGWNRTYGLSEAASMLRSDAQSLSRPTSEETL